jgi:MFS family permease
MCPVHVIYQEFKVIRMMNGAAGRSLQALRNRPFRVFFLGEAVSTVGAWMHMLAQSWVVLQLTGSGKALGLTIALQTLPILAVGPWAGVVADRVDNRRLLAIVAVAGAVQAVALGLLQATGNVTVLWVNAFALLLGVISAFHRPAMQAMIFELAGPDDLSSAIGVASTIDSGGRLLGPAIAGVLIATVGMAPVFFANALTFGAVLVALALVRGVERHERIVPGGQPARLGDGVRYILDTPTLRLTIGVMVVVGTFAYNFAIIVPAMIRFEFHASPLALGLVQGVGGTGAVLGGLAAVSLHRPTTRTVGLVASVFAAAIVIAAFAPGVAAFAVLWLPLGLASAVFSTVSQTVLQQEAAPRYQGRVMSLFTVAWIGTTPVGGLIAGAIIDRWSPRAAMGVGAAATALAGLMAVAVSRRSQVTIDLTAAPVPVVDSLPAP